MKNKESYLSIVIGCVGIVLFTWLLKGKHIDQVVYGSLMGGVMIVCISVAVLPRLKELDIKNLRLILNEVRDAQGRLEKTKREVETMYGGIERLRKAPLKLDEDFKYVIPALSSRYCVKPGITGWAQINGFRGETRRVSDMVSRIEHDRHYVKNWSLFLDIKILVLTVLKGWVHKNAY